MKTAVLKITTVTTMQLIILLFAMSYHAQTHAKGQAYVPPQAHHYDCNCK